MCLIPRVDALAATKRASLHDFFVSRKGPPSPARATQKSTKILEFAALLGAQSTKIPLIGAQSTKILEFAAFLGAQSAKILEFAGLLGAQSTKILEIANSLENFGKIN